MREVNKFRDPVFLCDASDRFGTGYMHGIEIEVPGEVRSDFVTQGCRPRILGFVVPSDEVVHNIRMSKALCGLLFVPQVPFLQSPNE